MIEFERMKKKRKLHFNMILNSKTILLYFTLGFTIIILSSIIPIFGLKIVDSAITHDQNKFVHLIGEVKNDDPNPVDNIYVKGILFGKNNSQLGNYSNQVDVHPLSHGETSPFDILVYDKGINELINTFKIELEFNSTSMEPKRDLTIGSVTSRLDFSGFYYISGRVTNNMNLMSNNTLIIASVVDKNGNLLGIWKAQTEPYNIPPLGSASFTIPVTDKIQSFKLNNYTLYINNL
jgi:hypothetical protein